MDIKDLTMGAKAKYGDEDVVVDSILAENDIIYIKLKKEVKPSKIDEEL